VPRRQKMHMSRLAVTPILRAMTLVTSQSAGRYRPPEPRSPTRRILLIALFGLLPAWSAAAPAAPPAVATAPGAPAPAAPAAIPRTVPPIEPRIAILPAAPAPRTVPPIEPRVTIGGASPGTEPQLAEPQAVDLQAIGPDPAESAAGADRTAASADDTANPDAGATAGSPPALSERLLTDADPADADPQQASQVPVEVSQPAVLPFKLLEEAVAPGSFAQLTWFATETFTSTAIPSAVLVAHGSSPGPVLCLTAAIHGDELNGIETVRRIMHDLDPTRLAGTVIGVPIVNIQGFHRGSRYLPDRRDLNRFFPGNPGGSSASRIAHSLFYNIIVRCNALVDLHTGSFHRTNLPQVRANLNDPGTVSITQGFGSTVIMHSEGADGTLRWAATQAGIPAVTLEAGGPMQVQEDAVAHSEQGIRLLLDTMGMYQQPGIRAQPAPAYYQSRWVRTDYGGILSGKVALGRQVLVGELLGTVVDPLTNQQQEIRSPLRGRVIGMALDQFVMPGYATFHIGIEAPVEEVMGAPDTPEVEYEAAEVEQGFDPS